jgi:hypothetical protein
MKSFTATFNKKPKSVSLMVTRVYSVDGNIIYSNVVKPVKQEMMKLEKKSRRKWELNLEYSEEDFADSSTIDVMVYPKVEV